MVVKIGMAIGVSLKKWGYVGTAVIGKDTRLSCYMIEGAIAAGLNAVGIDVLQVGVIPTPGLAMLTKTMNYDVGVMISASHNPYYDNGIKLFSPEGRKLSDDIELEIEKVIGSDDFSAFFVKEDKIGKKKIPERNLYQQRYIQFLKNSTNTIFSGLKIGLDTANGASYKIAPLILTEMGAEIIQIGNTPNGVNINEKCGSTDIKQLKQLVVDEKCDIGIAFDGDADRIILVDENGNEVNGDKIIAFLAKTMQEKKTLKSNKVVTTVMSNFGLGKYLQTLNLQLIQTSVGDRYVAEGMIEHNSNIGGEESGHIILSDYTTTGDGIMVALQILSILKEKKEKISTLTNLFTPFPQLLKNVNYEGGQPLENEKVKETIQAYEKKLEGNGRLLIRKSGTQPLIRVMAESSDQKLMEEAVNQIAEAIIAAK
jgi:phosphoglucosamine mutase